MQGRLGFGRSERVRRSEPGWNGRGQSARARCGIGGDAPDGKSRLTEMAEALGYEPADSSVHAELESGVEDGSER